MGRGGGGATYADDAPGLEVGIRLFEILQEARHLGSALRRRALRLEEGTEVLLLLLVRGWVPVFSRPTPSANDSSDAVAATMLDSRTRQCRRACPRRSRA